jgi:hypothetical protein
MNDFDVPLDPADTMTVRRNLWAVTLEGASRGTPTRG